MEHVTKRPRHMSAASEGETAEQATLCEFLLKVTSLTALLVSLFHEAALRDPAPAKTCQGEERLS